MLQLFNAVGYLHKRRVAHRDIKLENIVFESKRADSHVVLIDFGLAAALPEAPKDHFTTICGTSMYLAPEVIRQGQSDKSVPGLAVGYGLQSDMWSLGVVMHALLTGYFPFEKDPPELYDEIREGVYDTSGYPWPEISNTAKDIVSKVLTVDPKARVTPLEALEHPWCSNFLKNTHRPPGMNYIEGEAAKEGEDSWMSGALDQSLSYCQMDLPGHEPPKSEKPSKPTARRRGVMSCPRSPVVKKAEPPSKSKEVEGAEKSEAAYDKNAILDRLAKNRPERVKNPRTLSRAESFVLQPGQIDADDGISSTFVDHPKTEGLVYKTIDAPGEDKMYEAMNADPHIRPFLPAYHGVEQVDGETCVMLEDFQNKIPAATSSAYNIQIGFHTYQPDAMGMDLSSMMHYTKASKYYEDRVTEEEHDKQSVSQARFLCMKDEQSSCATHGFCINGVRLRHEVVPLDHLSKTVRVLTSLLKKGEVTADMINLIVKELKALKAALESSSLFKRHHIYGASVSIVVDYDADAKTPVMVKLTDVGNLVNRSSWGVNLSHVVTADQLPLPSDDVEDGFLTGLSILIEFLESFGP